MGYKSPQKFVMMTGIASSNPADSTTYYFFKNDALGLSGSYNAVKNPIALNCRVRGVALYVYNSTQNASAEATTLYLRVNDTTDYTVWASTWASGLVYNYSLNIPISVGDYLAFKLVTPAWATNPQGEFIHGTVYFESD